MPTDEMKEGEKGEGDLKILFENNKNENDQPRARIFCLSLNLRISPDPIRKRVLQLQSSVNLIEENDWPKLTGSH